MKPIIFITKNFIINISIINFFIFLIFLMISEMKFCFLILVFKQKKHSILLKDVIMMI